MCLRARPSADLNPGPEAGYYMVCGVSQAVVGGCWCGHLSRSLNAAGRMRFCRFQLEAAMPRLEVRGSVLAVSLVSGMSSAAHSTSIDQGLLGLTRKLVPKAEKYQED